MIMILKRYYEENRDIYNSFEDAYDGFTENPGVWE